MFRTVGGAGPRLQPGPGNGRCGSMRMVLPALLLSPALAAGAFAQASAPDKVLTPAPVPNRGSSLGAPADRAGRPDGGERAAPFSGLPSSLGAGSGQGTPSTLGSAEKDSPPTPSVSR